MNVKHPEVEVQLSGENGNAFSIMARVHRALERAGFRDEAAEYFNAAFEAESYGALLRLTMETVTVK